MVKSGFGDVGEYGKAFSFLAKGFSFGVWSLADIFVLISLVSVTGSEAWDIKGLEARSLYD